MRVKKLFSLFPPEQHPRSCDSRKRKVRLRIQPLSTAKPAACSCRRPQPLPAPLLDGPLPAGLRPRGFELQPEGPRSRPEVRKSAPEKSRFGFPSLLSRHKCSSCSDSRLARKPHWVNLLHHINELRRPFVQCFPLFTCVVGPCTEVFAQSRSPGSSVETGLIPKETWANHVAGEAGFHESFATLVLG